MAKIPPNNIDTWMHRTYNNNVLVKAEHGDYLVSITPEGLYKSYHVVLLLGNEKGYAVLSRAAAICRIHAMAMVAIKSDLAPFQVFCNAVFKLLDKEHENG